MAAAPSPGRRRQQRGAERRLSLIEATLRIIEEEGLEGVTHRRVADAAGVPLAATTYYFSSKEDLMQAAMETLIEREAASVGAIAEGVTESGAMTLDEGVEALIAWQIHLLRDRRMAQFAEMELYLRVARTAPRPDDLPDWPGAFLDVAIAAMRALGSDAPERDGRALVALIHGLVLHALVSKDPDFPEEVLAPVIRAWFRQALAQSPVAAD
jgi:DNA-binding transcriptional regulator YbjK